MSTKVATDTLLNAATATGAGTEKEPFGQKRSFQLTGFTSLGSGTADVDIEASNDGINFFQLGRLSLILGVSVTQAAMLSDAPWRFVRGNVIAISGTGAQVTLTMGNLA